MVIAQVNPSGPSVVLKTRGMVCSFCVQGVEKKLLALKGVRKVEVLLKTNAVNVWLHDGVSVSDSEFKAAVEAAGYNVNEVIRKIAPAVERPAQTPHKETSTPLP